MDDKDRITASPSSHRTADTIRIVDDGHEPAAATLETIASTQDKNRKVSGDIPQEHPPILRKEALLQRGRGSPEFEMPPSSTTMSATTQRIISSPKKKKFRSQGESKSTSSFRTPLKSPPSSNPPSANLQIGQRILSSSPAKEYPPFLPPRPRPGHSPRSSSQDGNFFNKVEKGREKVHSGSLKAAGFINKVSHVAWDKLKSPRLSKSGGSGRSSSPQQGHKDKTETRDTSNDIDVFSMDLKEAVSRTRIVSDRKMGGDAAYWIPAIAYRCLQYLNVYGPHELGIYRISGSTSVVDELRAEFKIHHDVDLFESPPDDLHTVSSLLKGWFRSLPDAVLPLDVQKRIYEKCKDRTDSSRPPQAFIDELSNLPPYNYYLLNHLFSHLSTICLASDINKMNLSNLGMIFCSTLRIDRFCFNWLVNSWSDCWAGCLTEEDEYQRTLPKRCSSDASSNMPRHRPTYSSDSRSTSRTGRTVDTGDGGPDRWHSASGVEQRTGSPLTGSTGEVTAAAGHDNQEQEKAKAQENKDGSEEMVTGAQEKDECEAVEVLIEPGTPSSKSSCSVHSFEGPDDRFSTMVQVNGIPRGSLNTNFEPLSPLPPIQPVSPMVKEGYGI